MPVKTASGEFTPKKPDKYVGTYPITYRSGWELMFMNFCDNHPNIISWASESIKIPYKNPLRPNVPSIYVPDFFIMYIDKNGKQHGELIEIKPSKQTFQEMAKTKYDILSLAINMAKWDAARAYAKKNGMVFRVMTEDSLFATPRNLAKRTK